MSPKTLLAGIMTGADEGIRLKARDAAQHRRAEKRAFEQADRRTAEQERLFERKHKESATMEM